MGGEAGRSSLRRGHGGRISPADCGPVSWQGSTTLAAHVRIMRRPRELFRYPQQPLRPGQWASGRRIGMIPDRPHQAGAALRGTRRPRPVCSRLRSSPTSSGGAAGDRRDVVGLGPQVAILTDLIGPPVLPVARSGRGCRPHRCDPHRPHRAGALPVPPADLAPMAPLRSSPTP